MVKTDSNLFWLRKTILIKIWLYGSDTLDLMVLWLAIIIFLVYLWAWHLCENQSKKTLLTTILGLFYFQFNFIIQFRHWILKKLKKGKPKSHIHFSHLCVPRKRAITQLSLTENCNCEQILNTAKEEMINECFLWCLLWNISDNCAAPADDTWEVSWEGHGVLLGHQEPSLAQIPDELPGETLSSLPLNLFSLCIREQVLIFCFMTFFFRAVHMLLLQQEALGWTQPNLLFFCLFFPPFHFISFSVMCFFS